MANKLWIGIILIVAIVVLFYVQRIVNPVAPDNSQQPDTAQQTPPPTTPTDPALTKMPDTTVVDGKTVTLHTMAGGLKYYDVAVGTGPQAQPGKTASMQYTGTLLNGAKFDSTADHGGAPFSFSLGRHAVIPGWDMGVPGMKVGGERILVIPGNLAYGPQSPSPKIPANATLVFDVKLAGVK